MNLITFLLHKVKSIPDETALIQSKEDISLTYSQLYEKICRQAYFFSSMGIKKGTKVALMLPDSIDLVSSFLSLIYLGAVPVMIDNRSCQREFLCYLETSGTSICITHIKGHKISIDTLLTKCNQLFLLNQEDLCSDERSIPFYPDRLEKPAADFTYSREKSSAILFSYRGIGEPLPVRISERALLLNLTADARVSRVRQGMRVAHILPTTHIFALTSSVLCPLLWGAAVVILNNTMPGRMLSAIEKYRVNFLIAVPTIVRVLIKTWEKKPGNYDISCCTSAIIGGDSLDKDLFDKWESITGGGQLMQGYGLTETMPVLCNIPGSYKIESLGKPMKHVKTRIITAEGKEASKGEPGRLFISTPYMMTGYVKKHPETASLLREGWFDTGDIVREDQDGFFFFERRDKKIAKIGGSTVDYTEVENIASGCPGVKEVKLVLEPDPVWSEKMTLYVTGQHITREEVTDYLRHHLATYKIPKDIKIVSG